MLTCKSLPAIFGHPFVNHFDLSKSTKIISFSDDIFDVCPLRRNLYFDTKGDNNGGNGIEEDNHNSCPVRNYEDLQYYTEGLGSKSLNEGGEVKSESRRNRRSCLRTEISGDEDDSHGAKVTRCSRRARESHGAKATRCSCRAREIPPPISSIGSNGEGRSCFRSYRKDGRFILKTRAPRFFLHPVREGGQLKLYRLHQLEIEERPKNREDKQ